MKVCDWCLNEHHDDELHVVPAPPGEELDDLVCRFCDPNGGRDR